MTAPTAVTADPPVIRCGNCNHPWHAGDCREFLCRCSRGTPPSAEMRGLPVREFAVDEPPLAGVALLASMHDGRRADVGEMLVGLGWETVVARDYDEAITMLTEVTPTLLVIDAMGSRQMGATLPQFLTWLRGRGDRPQGIVYLTQKGMRRGLIGAHGPMVRKPVDRESLARAVRSVGVLLSAGPIPDCYVDLHRGAIVGPAGRVHLTYIETNLLAYLTTHHGKVVSSGKLLTDVWGYATPFGASTLARAHMSNLRAKLVDAGLPDDVILTYRGRGYLCQAEMPLVGNPDAVLR